MSNVINFPNSKEVNLKSKLLKLHHKSLMLLESYLEEDDNNCDDVLILLTMAAALLANTITASGTSKKDQHEMIIEIIKTYKLYV